MITKVPVRTEHQPEHMILCFDERVNRWQVEVVTGILFIAPLHDHVSNGDLSQVFLEQQMSLTSQI